MSPSQFSRTKNTEKILVVDDNVVSRQVVQAVLRTRGFVIGMANNGMEAKSWLQENPVDLVILDIMMPQLSGTELAAWMRSQPRLKRIPIIFFTSVCDKETIYEATSLGNVDYLLKPLRPQLLLDRISKILQRSQAKEWTLPGWVGKEVELPGEDLISKVRVPTFSHTTKTVIELINQDNPDLESFVDVISSDPGLAAAVLTLANSSEFGFHSKVFSIEDACQLIGVQDLSSVCLSSTLSQEMKVDSEDQVQECWEYCLWTGNLAPIIANMVFPAEEESVAIAGVLHGLGLISLMGSPEIDYDKVIEHAKNEHQDLSAAEKELLGMSHNELGGRIAADMGFRPAICEIIVGCEDATGVKRLDIWCVAFASTVIQVKLPKFTRYADVSEKLEILVRRFPQQWEAIKSGMEAMVEKSAKKHQILFGVE